MPDTIETFTDDFDRANGPTGNGWTDLYQDPDSIAQIVNLRECSQTDVGSTLIGRNALTHRPCYTGSGGRDYYRYYIQIGSVRQAPTPGSYSARNERVFGLQFGPGNSSYKPKLFLKITDTSITLYFFYKNSGGTFQANTIATWSYASIGNNYINNIRLEVRRVASDPTFQQRTYRVMFTPPVGSPVDASGSITNFPNAGLPAGAKPQEIFMGHGDPLSGDQGPDYLYYGSTFATTGYILSEWNDFEEALYSGEVQAYSPSDEEDIPEWRVIT